jgi:hypothetical protein
MSHCNNIFHFVYYYVTGTKLCTEMNFGVLKKIPFGYGVLKEKKVPNHWSKLSIASLNTYTKINTILWIEFNWLGIGLKWLSRLYCQSRTLRPVRIFILTLKC